MIGFIPAWGREHLAHAGIRPQRSVHPRAGGEHAPTVRERAVLRFIPARAGNTIAHPRLELLAGSSPHGREHPGSQ